MTRRFIPEIHDPILTEMNVKWRRTDQEIADEMGFDKVTIRVHRTRLNLPINWRPRLPACPQFKEPPTRPHKEKPNPILIAQTYLGKRLVEKPSGFWLDGQPVSLDEVMRAANSVLKAHRMDQVGIPKWRV